MPSDLVAYLEETASKFESQQEDVESGKSSHSSHHERQTRPKIIRWISALVKQRSKHHQQTSGNDDGDNDQPANSSSRPASISSNLSRVSRMSGSSQRSYENPVLESMQTILDLVTCLDARSKPGMRRWTSRSDPSIDEYRDVVLRLKGQVEEYVEHPAVTQSGMHTSPKDLVMLCDTVRIIKPGERDPVIMSLNTETLNDVRVQLKEWFEAFLVAPKESVDNQRFQGYIPSPLRHSINADQLDNDGGQGESSTGQGMVIVDDSAAESVNNQGDALAVPQPAYESKA